MPQQFELAVRGVIIDRGQLLVFRARPEFDWFCLPGGKIEWQEDILTALVRELEEETAVVPQLGKLLFTHEMLVGERHRIEWFYEVVNAAAFRKLDLAKATHGFETAEARWFDLPLATDAPRVLPQGIVAQLPHAGEPKLVTSRA